MLILAVDPVQLKTKGHSSLLSRAQTTLTLSVKGGRNVCKHSGRFDSAPIIRIDLRVARGK